MVVKPETISDEEKRRLLNYGATKECWKSYMHKRYKVLLSVITNRKFWRQIQLRSDKMIGHTLRHDSLIKKVTEGRNSSVTSCFRVDASKGRHPW